MNPSLTRRTFLAGTASALAMPTILPARALGRGGAVAPGNRLGLAVIGLGDRGNYHLNALSAFSEVQVLAMCDVRGDALRQVCGKFRAKAGSRDCAATQDFREILARPEVDAVTVAAPENWHAVMAIEAMKAGKDVYCEKALSLTVAEGRAICDSVQRTGRVLQAGTQQRSDPRFRFACELARNGYLGDLQSVYVAVPGGRRMLKLPPAPVPPGLHYDLWLGPAPDKPYRENLCNYNWYFLTDYCAGWIQSWGVHHLDIALWGAPGLMASTVEVEGTADFLAEGDADVSFGWKVRATTPKGLRMDFHDDASGPLGHGVRFIGDKGWVHVTRGGIRAEPASLLDVRIKPGEERLHRSDNHMENFLQCVRSRREPAAPARVCHAATTLSLVADIASRSGRKLLWDWGRERFTDGEPANRMLSRTLRQPWHV
ncbi:MAG: Gfo/Idh/MocA family oxidoreductase [Kiritimatiellia bacterium]|nr:Gfo/Idh/MocA family oxidoreductase [Kiritimatiellia bacterium]